MYADDHVLFKNIGRLKTTYLFTEINTVII